MFTNKLEDILRVYFLSAELIYEYRTFENFILASISINQFILNSPGNESILNDFSTSNCRR
jgi:hypothetical protein